MRQGIPYLRLSPAPLQSAPGLHLRRGPLPSPTTTPALGPGMGNCPTLTLLTSSLPLASWKSPPRTGPAIIERDAFVDLAAVTLNLSACQTAVFRRIAFRAGSASQGCFESQDNMARYLGYKRRAIQMALHHLQDLGLIHRVGAFYGSGKSNTYVPIFRLSPFAHQ